MSRNEKLVFGYLLFSYLTTIMIIKYAINKYRNGDTCLHVSMVSIFSMHENQLESLWKHRFIRNYPRDSGTAGLNASWEFVFLITSQIFLCNHSELPRRPHYVVGTIRCFTIQFKWYSSHLISKSEQWIYVIMYTNIQLKLNNIIQ